jgi:hypothetical protein
LEFRIGGDMSVLDKIDEKLNESGVSLLGIADSFARYLIGDRNIALNELKKMQNLPTKGLADMEAAEYNKLYQKLQVELSKVISKNMKGLMG